MTHTITATLDMITPGLCGGANPTGQAEIRPPSIRGQLRWWFRTLGGFKSLEPKALREQEAGIFGSIAGETGRASRLQVRVRMVHEGRTVVSDLNGLKVRNDTAYLLYPLRTRKRSLFRRESLPSFQLLLSWRGDTTLTDDLKALLTVFGCLGSIGSRSRRGFGALAFRDGTQPMSLADAFARFSHQSDIIIREFPGKYGKPDDAHNALGGWLKSWRSRGSFTECEPQSRLSYERRRSRHAVLGNGRAAKPTVRRSVFR